MQFITLFSLCALVFGAVAAPRRASYTLHEKRAAKPLHWEKHSRADANTLLPVRIGLTQSNLDKGPTWLDEVSIPDHPKYGQHYAAEQIHDLFAPNNESVTIVKDWLHGSGIQPARISQSANKQWLQLDASVAEMENLIQTEYYHYKHVQTGKTNIGCDAYHVPDHVTKHIDYVTPGLKLLTPSTPRDGIAKRTFGIAEGPGKQPEPPLTKPLPMPLKSLLGLVLEFVCPLAIIPACITTMYNISEPTKAAPNNQLGIFEDIDDKYSQTDLNQFFLTLAPQIPQGTHPILDGIDGATAPQTTLSMAGQESDLDFQISYPIIYPQNSVLYQTDDVVYEADYIYDGFFNNFLDAIDGTSYKLTCFDLTGIYEELLPTYV